ncbi:hypothetical protein K7X08_010510 [Anisodus acutangulus]|uniref:Uncharacterized protein n=1 Tax=Anisodus acutangulus TaxID=402998 RepID=A0A9Q1N7C2_9SOLA|nr:hypothetical protein K7X08_010510 [Anisodus acutangulus]
MLMRIQAFKGSTKANEVDGANKNKFNILQEKEKDNRCNNDTSILEEMTPGQENHKGDNAIPMSNGDDDNTNEKMEQLCNEGAKAEVQKEGKSIDNVSTKEWIKQSFFGNNDRVEYVEGTYDLEEVTETTEQTLIDSAQSSEKVEDVLPSTEGFEDEQRILSDHQCIGDVKEVHRSGMPEKLDVQVQIFEKDLVDVHNKEMEVVEERMNGDMLSNNEELKNSPVHTNAQAIVQVP